jgi:hypothetical protein
MEKVICGENTTIEHKMCGEREPLILIHGSLIPDSFIPWLRSTL